MHLTTHNCQLYMGNGQISPVAASISLFVSTLCSKKSDTKIQITKNKYLLSGFNYHLSDVNVANFNKIHRTVSKQQLF